MFFVPAEQMYDDMNVRGLMFTYIQAAEVR